MPARLLVPEVVQSSAMDCGPAALKATLNGLGIGASYGRLREACQTDVDGTSVDTIEDVARKLGLDARQEVVPREHLCLSTADILPAIVVTRLPHGATHFVVVWNRMGPWLQLMDPASGRQWVRAETFVRDLYRHEVSVDAEAFQAWVELPSFVGPMQRRLRALDIAGANTIVAAAANDGHWMALARLDAAIRLTEELARGGAVKRGAEARRMMLALTTRTSSEDPFRSIPERYWFAKPCPGTNKVVVLAGAVALRARRRIARKPGDAGTDPRSAELARVLDDATPAIVPWLARLLQQSGPGALGLLAAVLVLVAGGLILQALLFRGILEIGDRLVDPSLRMGAAGALLLFFAIMMGLEWSLVTLGMRLGRHLEARLRMAFLRKVPRLNDRYFQSRLSSDMAERCHSLHAARGLPGLAIGAIRSLLMLVFTVGAMAWLNLRALPLSLIVVAASVVLPLMFQPLLAERDLRMRTQSGALSRFYLDALLGLIPIRAHGGERAIRREHEAMLTKWLGAGLDLQRAAVGVSGIVALLALGLSAGIVAQHAGSDGGTPGVVLLMVYWALALPQYGQELASAFRRYAPLKSLLLRMLEPLEAPEDPVPEELPLLATAPTIAFEGVEIVAAGQSILRGLSLEVEAGSHVAIVGQSGAGKSSLVGLLLGWHRPASGRVLVDGVELDAARLDQLRRSTAWVDPSAQLFQSSLYSNLRYGNASSSAMTRVLERADLGGVIQRLPDGLQTLLGEGGGLLSGGEGQRVRLGRALMRDPAPLAILDEPFRALDRGRRHELMTRAREHWADSTVLLITHDLSQTLTFDRVLVVEDGRVVEDGSPSTLMTTPHSRYRALVAAESEVHRGLWGDGTWRRLELAKGRVTEAPCPKGLT